jgi:hypothetical protein
LYEDQNQFSKGCLAGLVAAFLMFVFVESFRWAGLTKFGISKLAGDTVFTYQNNLLMSIIAFLINELVGMFWGVVIAFLFTKFFAGDYFFSKMLFVCFCIFFFHLGFLDEPFHYPREIHKQTLDLLVIMMGYMIYGITLGAIFKKLRLIKS